MTQLLWDQVGDRLYETGIDRGVLYLEDGTAVPWMGLRSVDEDFSSEAGAPVYVDGLKYADTTTANDFAATLKAFTYPDEFLEYDGVLELADGFFVDHQRPKVFSLSYRTLVGNDIEGQEHGYKIHILYNLMAAPDVDAHETLTRSATAPRDFSWKLSAVPEPITGYKPTAHIILDSTRLDPYHLAEIEDRLYGTASTAPELPPLDEFATELMAWDAIVIIDHGDGTWSATGPDEYFTMVTPTQFEIREADATYLDADTYTVTDEE